MSQLVVRENAGGTRPGELAAASRGEWLALPQHIRDSYLPPSARELIVKGIPENTLKAYTLAWQAFRGWCEEMRRTFAPVSQDTMISYLDFQRAKPIHVKCKGGKQSNGEPCAGHRPSPSAVWIWYSAVKFYHGVGEPPLAWNIGQRLMKAIAGYQVEMTEQGWVPHEAPRAHESDVTRMVDSCDLDTDKGVRDRAIILHGFYTAARASDIGTYRVTDVGRFPLGLELTLRMQKTQKRSRVGRTVSHRVIFENATHPQYCGVEAVDAWIAYLRGLGITTGALYRPFNRWGQLLRGPQDAPSYRMDSTSISEVIQDAAKRAGLPNAEDYTQHSLRRGRASQQRELGGDALDIARMYDWAPGGAVNRYLEEADRQAPTSLGAVGLL